MRLPLIVALGLTVAGCVTAPAAGTDSSAIRYRCEGGKGFSAAWNQPGDRVRVTAGGVTRVLPHAPSASGARYASGAHEIWGKGDAASLAGFPGGPYAHCRAS
ncbi:MAG: MliC family protein [Caulobacter sp.]|nr:MliC family protein [Caulobacter sp.]